MTRLTYCPKCTVDKDGHLIPLW